MNKAEKVPFVTVQEASIFGEMPERVQQGQDDFATLPGYSDVRQKIEHDVRAGRPATPLPRRFHLTRASTLAGTPDLRKVAERVRKGYRLVRWDEAESLGIKLEDAGSPITSFTKAADGTVRVNEYALMVCDAAHAARNLKEIQQRNDEMYDAQLDNGLSGQKRILAVRKAEESSK